MTSINFLKSTFMGIGAVLSFIVGLLGGWDGGLATLVTFMIIDYTTGFIVAAIFKNSNKTETGALSSKVGFAGLAKKCMILLYVLVAFKLDLLLGIDYVRNAVIIGYILNELVSITENAGLMGVSMPPIITKAIDLLKNKLDGDNNGNTK